MKNKRFLSILLSLLIVLSAIPFAGNIALAETLTYDDLTKEEGGTEEGEAAYTAYMEQEGRLSNFYAKLRDLQAGESLNVAYFGGSVTNGSGASSQNTTSWRGLVGTHITSLVQEAHPDVTVENKILYPSQSDQFDDVTEGSIIINNINAATGATASYFGVHRTYDDLGFATKAPDVVFLEFTFNDDGAGDNASRTYTDSNGKEAIAPAVEYEGIIRQIYTYAPDCEIIAVFTTGAKFMNHITQDEYPTLSAERAVLRNYNIPYLYVGRDLVNHIISIDSTAANITTSNYSKNATWLTYITDSVHPTDAGYQFYADIINNYIDARFAALKAVDTDGTTIGVENFVPTGFVASDYGAVPSYHDSSIIKANPHQIRAYALYEGENEELLSGYQEFVPSNSAASTLTNHGNALASKFTGASLAFRFTGDSVGLWCAAVKNAGGILNAKVYKIDEETNERSSEPVAEITREQNSSSVKPITVVIASQLEYATYEVDIWMTESDYGSESEICRIFWNGEDTITPSEHPDITLEAVYPDIEVLSKFVGTSYNYNVSSITENEDGSYRLKYDGTETDDGTGKTYISLVATNLTSYLASVEHYKYMFVEYFVPADSTYDFNNVSMRVRQTDQMAANDNNMYNKTYHSDELAKGEWATAVIDISTYMDDCIAAEEPGATYNSNWKWIEFYPFGSSASPAEAMTGATIDIKSIRFSTSPTPTVPEEDEEGEKTVYVQSSGLITFPDYGEADAYTNFSDAFDALGEAGGTIIFQGEFATLKDGTAPHGDVTVMGLGDTDEERAQNILNMDALADLVIQYGNVTLDNLSLKVNSSVYFNSRGYTLTFGKNVVMSDDTTTNIYVGPHSSNPTASNIVFNAENAAYARVSTMGGSTSASSGTKFSGHSNYTFNAGTFANVYGGTYFATTGKYYSGYGDVNYTFNGGTYTGVVSTNHQRAGERYGNVIFTINGGTFNNTKNAISFGSNTTHTVDGVELKNPGADVVIVNCKEVSKTATGALSATDTKISIGALYHNNYPLTGETTMAILNNAELADTVKVAITRASSTASLVADYQITANYGKVIPVFAESSTETTSTTAGALLGFQMVGDTEEHIPYVDGVKLEPKANGLYDLPENFVGTVEFIGPKTVYASTTGTVTLTDGTVLTGEEQGVYTTFADAFDALGTEGGKIYFQGEFTTFADGSKAHGDVEVIGIGDTDELRAQNKITIPSSGTNWTQHRIYYGNVTFKNLSLSSAKETIYWYAKDYTLTFGENVVISADSPKNIYAAPFWGKASGGSFVFSAKDAIYTAVGAMGGGTKEATSFSGNVNSVFNAGTFTNVFDAYNTLSDGTFKGYGDVNYTFNGGTFTRVSPNAFKGGSRIGNVIYTINGGTFTNDIFFGQYTESSEGITHTNPGAAVIIANCKEISQTATGKLADSTLGIGTPREYGGHSATEIAILNNAELASTVKVAIDSTATATYRIKANYGKVTPVFEASSTETTSTEAGALLGFSMESDLANAYPYVNGVKLEPNEDGYYTLPEGATTVNFLVLPGDVDSDDTVNIVDIVRIAKYINEMEVDINFVDSDLNGDGYITSDDKNLLRQILLQASNK